MPRICVTRALKNARYLQTVAPHIIPPVEPLEGFASLVPLHVLTVLHRKQVHKIPGRPDLTELLQTIQLPAIGNQAVDPLFSGTLLFVQITFNTRAGAVSVNNADMTTALEFATLAAIPISAYVTQYGTNSLRVSQTILPFSVDLPAGRYNDQTLQGWINTIVNQNGLPNSSGLVVLNPQGVTNTDGDINQGILGYHGKANVPYCFVNVFGQNLTVQDTDDFYAWQLSHEVAEMTVDPNANNRNPEVCDACGPNCPPSWRDFFIGPDNTYSQTTEVFPPGFEFTFFINAIVQPNSATQCPAKQAACAYAPPVLSNRLVLYDRSAGQADVVGFNANGNTSLDTTNSGWRTSWDIIVSGEFIGDGRDQILLYDRSAGQADAVGFDANGNTNLDTTNSGWRSSWATIVAGDFIGNGLDQILLYDQVAGQADVVGFDPNGDTDIDTTNSGWRTSWNIIMPGEFVGNGHDQILLYDRAAGQADVVGFDLNGNTNLDTTNSGWRSSWDMIVVGNFIGNGRDQILLYDRSAGQADVVGFDANGNLNLDTTNSGWRSSWDIIVAGDFIGNGRDQILLYDRSAGQADVVGFDANGNLNLDTTNSGWRSSWDIIVVGDFIGNGHDQILLYDRSAGQADVVGFDANGNLNLDTTNSGWRSSWDILVTL